MTARTPLVINSGAIQELQSGDTFNLGTPSTLTLTNATGLPVATGISGLGANVATFLATPSSANLASAVSDETGSGALVFATSPTLAGTPTAPTAAAGTNTTQLATTAHVFAERSNAFTLTNKTISGASNTLTNIGNSSLTNSSVTVGTTNIALGATSLTLAGLTSVTATTFNGALSGNATTATTATNLAGGAASQIPYQTGSGATTFLANGTSGRVLTSNGASAPSWGSNTVTIGSTSVALGTTAGSIAGLTSLSSTGVTVTSLTSGRVVYATTGGLLTNSSALAFDGTTLALTGVLTVTQDSTFSSTGALKISSGTTAQQPVAPAVGMMRYNTTTNQFEGYSSGGWGSLGSSSFVNLSASGSVTLSGGTANGVAYLNGSKVLTTGSALTFDGTTLTSTGFSGPLTGNVTGNVSGNAGTVTNGVYTTGDQTIGGTKTFSSNPVLNGGTANGVAYLNGSKVLTTGSALTFNGTTLTSTGFSGPLTGNVTGNVSGNAGTVTNGVYTTGDQTIGGTKTFSSNPVLNGGTANGVAYLNGSKVLTTGSALTFDGTTLTSGTHTIASGNLNLTGTGNRITGDFSNATLANRVLFQNSASNTDTYLGIAPNGTSVASGLLAFNSSSPDNSGYGGFTVGSGSVTFLSGKIGTGTYLPMTFSTGGSERMRIDTSGNLGLGVTPSAWDSNGVIQAKNAFMTGQSSSQVLFGSNSYYNGGWKYNATNYASYYEQYLGQHRWFTAPSGTAGNAITFTQAMTLDASGNLGIGTSSPASKLHVSGGDIQLSAGNSLKYSSTAYITPENNVSGAEISTTGIITFKTGSGPTERMRIDSSGNLLVGTTTAIAKLSVSATSGTYAGYIANTTKNSNILLLAGSSDSDSQNKIVFANGGSVCGLIYTTATTTSYGTSSDYRLKENIQPMQNALAVVQQLNPVTYTWKADGSDGQGFIAHELQAVVPDCVTGEKDGEQMQGVDYGKITPLLTAALQEAMKKIEQLEARIATLETK